MPRLPPLIALRAFEAVGRTGSVRAAGEELNVSHTVISRHVHNLEERLRVKLLAAAGRGITLTREGANFHGEITRAFEIIARATGQLNHRTRPPFEIWSVPGLANRRLLAQINALIARLPEREIILRPTLARPNLERREAAAEIIYLQQPDTRPGRRTELLAQPRVFPIASPAFCARVGRIAAIADLVRLPLIHEESTDQWRSWFAAAGHPVESLGGPHLWHAHLAMEAARLGQGVALTNEILAADDLCSGAIVEIVPSQVVLGGYYLVSLDAHTGDAAIDTLKHWLAEIFAARERLVHGTHQSLQTN